MRNLRKQLEAMVKQAQTAEAEAFQAYISITPRLEDYKAIRSNARDSYLEAKAELKGLQAALDALYKEL